jgi:acetyl-CoA decarbonylase/synthase complex subunit gamma
MNVTPDMRELNFSLKDRLALVPIELVIGLKSLPVVGFTSGLAGAFSRGSFSLQGGFTFFLYAFIGIITGTVVVPLLLPWLPSRSFAVKGALTGLLVAGALLMAQSGSLLWYEAAALMLLMTSISSFFALNFTGSTPFTSRSGVKKEMRLSLPAMAAAAIAGFSFLVIGRFAG